jgi:hypothetical protein
MRVQSKWLFASLALLASAIVFATGVNIFINDKMTVSLPDLSVEEIKVQTEEGGLFAYGKIKNSGAPLHPDQYFWITSQEFIPGDANSYDNEERVTFAGEYLGGLDKRNSEAGVNTYPWTLLRGDVVKGANIKVILDPQNEIRESNEGNNTFVFELPRSKLRGF